MNPVQPPSNNLRLEPPADRDEARNGACLTLHCTRDGNGNLLSFWKPSPEELAHLNANGHVVLSVAGQMPPPVWVGADVPPAEPQPT